MGKGNPNLRYQVAIIIFCKSLMCVSRPSLGPINPYLKFCHINLSSNLVICIQMGPQYTQPNSPTDFQA